MQFRLGSFVASISARYRQVYVVLLVMSCLGLLAYAVDHFLLGFDINSELHSAVHASIVGLGGAAAVWVILRSYEARRRMEMEEIRKVAELNHCLRNSMELIADAHYFEKDAEHKRMMLETVKTMDEKLRQLFPAQAGGPRPLPKGTTPHTH